MYATGVAGLLQRLRLPQLTVFLRAVCVREHGLDNVRIIRTILRHVEQEGSGAAFRVFRIRKTAKRAVEQDGSLCARERLVRAEKSIRGEMCIRDSFLSAWGDLL